MEGFQKNILRKILIKVWLINIVYIIIFFLKRKITSFHVIMSSLKNEENSKKNNHKNTEELKTIEHLEYESTPGTSKITLKKILLREF